LLPLVRFVWYTDASPSVAPNMRRRSSIVAEGIGLAGYIQSEGVQR
jgi:hypothetical protein